MDIVQLDSGPGFCLYALVINKICMVQEFIESLELKYQKQVFALFELILQHGPPINEQKFRKLEDKIYELKTRGGIRILCFYGGSDLPKSLILTHGFYKPKQRILKREIEKAIEWRKEYLECTDINQE